jgi:DNA polymerase-3 subunit alpha
VVRDVGRVLGIPYSEVDKIAKLIPPRGDITIEEALRIEPALRELQKKPEIRNLLEIARSLEGLTRHASMHAAGIVIGREELTNYLPLYLAKQSPNQEERIITTQFDMQAIEKIGLLKIDLLGLKTLSVIRKTIEQIKERTGREIKIEEVPLEDSQTYETLSRGETAGIFQLESAGMRDLLRKLKPEKIEDLIALLALYRPGTLQGGYVDSFIKRKHKKAEIKYLVPQLEEILKETYGVIIYQEQVMKIAHQLGGFSYGEADILRKAMGKKNPEVMEKQRQKFIEGAVKNNIPRDKAEEVFKLMAHFSGYGFVKAHSAAYALISYQTAYLKTHFPQEFMAALLTSEIGNTSQIALYVNECRKMGIKVLPPDVNTSYAHFSITFEGISFGLQAVKNVGAGAIESIIQAREKHGPFKSLDDFCQWVDLRMVNRRVIESLIKCGAFDSFNKPRAQLFIELDETLKKAERVQKERKQAQISLFELWKVEQKEKKKEVEKKIPEWPESELLSLEKEMLGLYISRHPLSKFEREIKNYASTSTQKLKELSDKEEVSVAGIITEMKQITDKKNRKMAFLTLEDLEGSVEVVVFADLFEKVSRYIFEDAAVLIRGRVSLSERNAKIMASDIIPLAEIKRKATRAIRIKFFTTGLEEEILNNLQEILSSHPGKCPVYLDFISSLGEEVEIIPSSAFYVNPSEELLLELNQLVGEDKVQVVL